MTARIYNSSTGPKDVGSMNYFNAKAAHTKLLREAPHRTQEIAWLAERVAELDTEQAGQTSDAPAPIGHNNPPEPTTFEGVKARIDDLMARAKAMTSRPIASQSDADAINALMADLRKAASTADEIRKRENEPFDAGKAAVQAKYAPLIADTKAQKGVTVLALESLKALLTPWLKKVEDEQKAAAEVARKKAEALTQAATDAAKAAQPGDLMSQVEAEQLGQIATAAIKVANVAEGAKAHATGGVRATGLRSYFTPYLTDPREALLHYLAQRPDDIRNFLVELAEADIKAGVRSIPGFRIEEERRVA